MPSSHPPTLMVTVERTLKEDCRVSPGSRILLAVSGGGDSMAMLHVMAAISQRLGLGLHAHGINHGLRDEAEAELTLAEQLASLLGIPFTRSKVSVLKGANLQARARDQRYEALREVARTLSIPLIATAHHADDRAETVLIRLMRGAGPTGLAVLAPHFGDLLRPLIRARRFDIRAHLARNQIICAEDPSNQDPHYLRTRVRQEILPALVRESPGMVEHLNSLADRMIEITAGGTNTSLGLARAQAEELHRVIQLRREGAEIALGEGWLLKLERKRIPTTSKSEPT